VEANCIYYVVEELSYGNLGPGGSEGWSSHRFYLPSAGPPFSEVQLLCCYIY
jgi:hypothetical protein